MKVLCGIVLVLLGLAVGLYVGLWLCLAGGIIQIVNALQVSPIDGTGIAVGVIRIICSSLAGGFAALVCLLPGMALLK